MGQILDKGGYGMEGGERGLCLVLQSCYRGVTDGLLPGSVVILEMKNVEGKYRKKSRPLLITTQNQCFLPKDYGNGKKVEELPILGHGQLKN